MSSKKIDFYLYGAILGIYLGCSGMEKTQVYRMLELVSSEKKDPLAVLLGFVSYQYGKEEENEKKNKKGKEKKKEKKKELRTATFSIIECFRKLKEEKPDLSKEDIIEVLGFARWIYTLISSKRNEVCNQSNTKKPDTKKFDTKKSFSELLEQFKSTDEVIFKIFSSLDKNHGAES